MRSRPVLLGLIALVMAGCGTGDASTEPSMPGSRHGAPASAPATDSAAERSAVAAADLPACPATGALAAVDGGLPAITVDCLGAGPAVTVSGLRAAGRPMVLSVWASWCSPCAAEMPRLTRAADEYAGRVDFVGLDMLDDRIAALEWAAAFAMNFPSLYDHDGLLRDDLRIPGPPVAFFVTADGRIAHTSFGEITSDEALRTLIAEKLGVAR